MENNLQMEINLISTYYDKCFINKNNELILEPRNNIYFILDNVNSVLDLKCKLIEYTSRPSCKGVSKYWQDYFLKRFNSYFKTKFNKNEMMDIYTYLGCGANRMKCIKFIESNFDLSILKAAQDVRQ